MDPEQRKRLDQQRSEVLATVGFSEIRPGIYGHDLIHGEHDFSSASCTGAMLFLYQEGVREGMRMQQVKAREAFRDLLGEEFIREEANHDE
jgi:hypothetical protein